MDHTMFHKWLSKHTIFSWLYSLKSFKTFKQISHVTCTFNERYLKFVFCNGESKSEEGAGGKVSVLVKRHT